MKTITLRKITVDGSSHYNVDFLLLGELVATHDAASRSVVVIGKIINAWLEEGNIPYARTVIVKPL